MTPVVRPETATGTLLLAEKHVASIFHKLNLDATPDDHRRVLAVLKFMQRQ